jgi:outer membrane lipoprotein-sorting protein
MNKHLVLVVFASLAPTLAFAADLAPRDVMLKNESARKIGDVVSVAVLKTGGGDSVARTKKFTWWRKLNANGVDYNTLTRFSFPPEVKGEGILFLEHDKADPDVMIYLPTYKKIRRVQRQDQSGSFMASEFSYSDLATPHLEDFAYKMIKADDACEGGRCYVIESTPVNESVKDRTAISKQVAWIRKDNFMAARAEYYDLNGLLWKKLEAKQIKEIDPAKHKWMALSLRMENMRNQKWTELEYTDVKANEGIGDAVFTPKNLEKE